MRWRKRSFFTAQPRLKQAKDAHKATPDLRSPGTLIRFRFQTSLSPLSSGDKTADSDGAGAGVGGCILQPSLGRHGRALRYGAPLTLPTPRPQSEEAIKGWTGGRSLRGLQITPSPKRVKNKGKRRRTSQAHQDGEPSEKSRAPVIFRASVEDR